MIYIVTKGHYSDYHIVAATTDRETADRIAAKFTDDWQDATVEEFPDAEVMLKNLWCVYFKKSGEVWKCEPSNSEYDYHDGLDTIIDTIYKRNYDLIVTVEADTEEAAIKIAAEKRAKYLAEKNGL